MTGNGKDRTNPEMIVLGDSAADLFIYDRPDSKSADKRIEWIPQVSRESWQYAEGYEAKYCATGAAGIEAMSRINGRSVFGNSFMPGTKLTDPSTCGSIFVLRKTDNQNGNIKYVSVRGNTPKILSKNYTWRIRSSFLNSPNKKYSDWDFFYEKNKFDIESIEKSHLGLKSICLYDNGRGFFNKGIEGVKDFVACMASENVPIVIRTSNPQFFKEILEKSKENRAEVIMICPLSELLDDNLRSSGTWTTVWRLVYKTLSKKGFLRDDRTGDWKFYIIVPVYQDGAVLFGPSQQPKTPKNSQLCKILKENNFLKLSYGKLFILPGSQPRLYDFKEADLTVGASTFFTYSILEEVTNMQKRNRTIEGFSKVLNLSIRKALTRIRRFHFRGYCGLKDAKEGRWEELTPIPERISRAEANGGVNIHFPQELWAKRYQKFTDDLVTDDAQSFGAFEVECDVNHEGGSLEVPDRNSDLRGIESYLDGLFRSIHKCVDEEFASSPESCRAVAQMFKSRNVDEALKNTSIGECELSDGFIESCVKDYDMGKRISMQFGRMSLADPIDTGQIFDLTQRIRQHVTSYRYEPFGKGRVFSFAIFGTPGSGKSMLAEEIANAIDPSSSIFSTITYNLSQFSDTDQLLKAFGEVASEGLGGKVPIVLWDEFDSVLNGRRGGWLSQFLMPMQDSKYSEGGVDRPIGTAIFVFIGGTFPDGRAFREWACDGRGEGQEVPESVMLKGRDFHSRLVASLDMPPIVYFQENYRGVGKRKQKIPDFEEELNYVRLSRAVLVSVFLKKYSEVGGVVKLGEVSNDVLNFLLNVPLRHGARSLERIIEACLLHKPKKLGWHHVPPRKFLAEHVETDVEADKSRVDESLPTWARPKRDIDFVLDLIESKLKE